MPPATSVYASSSEIDVGGNEGDSQGYPYSSPVPNAFTSDVSCVRDPIAFSPAIKVGIKAIIGPYFAAFAWFMHSVRLSSSRGLLEVARGIGVEHSAGSRSRLHARHRATSGFATLSLCCPIRRRPNDLIASTWPLGRSCLPHMPFQHI
jgi:hypothetical protein